VPYWHLRDNRLKVLKKAAYIYIMLKVKKNKVKFFLNFVKYNQFWTCVQIFEVGEWMDEWMGVKHEIRDFLKQSKYTGDFLR
jgi:hypothetical protein